MAGKGTNKTSPNYALEHERLESESVPVVDISSEILSFGERLRPLSPSFDEADLFTAQERVFLAEMQNVLFDHVKSIKGDVALVRKAVGMITGIEGRGGKWRQLNQKVGVAYPPWHHVIEGVMLAKLNIDSASSTSAGRTASVIAGMVQEYVAHGLIPLEEIKTVFGPDVAHLTDSLSKVTRFPLKMWVPEPDGTLSYPQARDNREEHERGRDLINFMYEAGEEDHRPKIWLIKILDAVQQLRLADASTTDIAYRQNMALHVQGMYLPIVREASMKSVQDDMQERILRILDPVSKEAIEEIVGEYGGEDFAQKKLKPFIIATLEKAYGLAFDKIKKVSSIACRCKSSYSTWNKAIEKEFSEIDEAYELNVRSLDKQREEGRLGQEEYHRFRAEVEEQFKRKRVPVSQLIGRTGGEENSLRRSARPAQDKEERKRVIQDKIRSRITDLFGVRIEVKEASPRRRKKPFGGPQVQQNPLFDVDQLEREALDRANCIEIHTVLNSRFEALAGRFKDRILRPKSSGYKALHDTMELAVPGLRKACVEFQILTGKMHQDNTKHHALHKDRLRHVGAADKFLEKLQGAHHIVFGMVACLKGQQLPAGSAPSFKIIGDALDGSSSQYPSGATGLDVARAQGFLMSGESWRNIRLLTQEDLISGRREGCSCADKKVQEMLHKPLPHATLVHFWRTDDNGNTITEKTASKKNRKLKRNHVHL